MYVAVMGVLDNLELVGMTSHTSLMDILYYVGFNIEVGTHYVNAHYHVSFIR
jgi:hypothetical protein